MNSRPTKITLLISSLLLPGLALAHPPGGCRAMGSDMGPGPGMGREMMTPDMGRGMGPAMMGSGMMGHEMMGRMGAGMMRGMGLGRIMMVPDLTEQQRQSLIQRHRQLEKQMLDLEKQGLDARFAMEDVLAKPTPDPKAVGNAMQGVFNVRKKMVEAAIAAHNDVLGMLTDEQRQSLQGGRWMGHGNGMGAMRHHMMKQRQPSGSGGASGSNQSPPDPQ